MYGRSPVCKVHMSSPSGPVRQALTRYMGRIRWGGVSAAYARPIVETLWDDVDYAEIIVTETGTINR
jgi:hypothetical protein